MAKARLVGMHVTESTTFEKIAERYPYLIEHLLKIGVKVIVCGEVKWGTLGEELERLGLSKNEVVRELNELVDRNGGPARNLRLDI